jgi:hypothetical protein
MVTKEWSARAPLLPSMAPSADTILATRRRHKRTDLERPLSHRSKLPPRSRDRRCLVRPASCLVCGGLSDDAMSLSSGDRIVAISMSMRQEGISFWTCE